MDATTTTYQLWLLRTPTFAEECAALSAELDRDFEPLHRLAEELLARLDVSARMA